MVQGKSDSSIRLSKLSDVCIATSAAPTYLPSHYFKTQNEEFNCIDGAMAANNPVCTYVNIYTHLHVNICMHAGWLVLNC